jgi:hypothetical protein
MWGPILVLRMLTRGGAADTWHAVLDYFSRLGRHAVRLIPCVRGWQLPCVAVSLIPFRGRTRLPLLDALAHW